MAYINMRSETPDPAFILPAGFYSVRIHYGPLHRGERYPFFRKRQYRGNQCIPQEPDERNSDTSAGCWKGLPGRSGGRMAWRIDPMAGGGRRCRDCWPRIYGLAPIQGRKRCCHRMRSLSRALSRGNFDDTSSIRAYPHFDALHFGSFDRGYGIFPILGISVRSAIAW